MPLKIQDSWPPVTQQDIEDFERQTKLTLPNEYAEFLKSNNGGGSFGTMYFGEGSVDVFYGLKTGFDSCDLQWKFSIFTGQRRMPPGCLAIAGDPGGNQYVMVCQGKNRGQVWYWDHDNEPDPDSTDEDMFDSMWFQAKAFGQFLREIRIEPPKTRLKEPPFHLIEAGDARSLKRFAVQGGDINRIASEQSWDGITALGYAAFCGALECIDVLLHAGVDLDKCDAHGEQAIFQVCIGQRSSDALRLLLNAGVSPDIRTAAGIPLICRAVAYQAHRIVKWLLEYNVDLKATTPEGKTAVQIAEEVGDEQMVRVLATN